MKTIIRHLATFTFICVAALNLSSCKDDTGDPPPPTNEEELITTVKLRFFRASDTTFYREFMFKDPDGEGGNGPTRFDTLFFEANTVYLAELILLNEANPAKIEDITLEVKDEAKDHLFCYIDSQGLIGIQRTDTDGKYEIGIKSKWTVGTTGSGKVTVTLKHQPGVKNGSCDPGDTDVEVVFPYVVD